jgi:hypothetical protein
MRSGVVSGLLRMLIGYLIGVFFLAPILTEVFGIYL